MTDIKFSELDLTERIQVLNDFLNKTDDVALKLWASEGIYHTQGFRASLDTIQYAAECTLATVDDLALKKKIPISELKRQVSIAQHIIFELHSLKSCHYKDYVFKSRVKEVIDDHNKIVKSYTLALILKHHSQETHDKLKDKLDNY